MSLRDRACYTLTLVPSSQDPSIIELVEALEGGKEESRYARVREDRAEGEVYTAAIYGGERRFSLEEISDSSRLFERGEARFCRVCE